MHPMAFPRRTCVVCAEEFELRPGKPGFANRCPECSDPDQEGGTGNTRTPMDATERKAEADANEARRAAIRELLYSRK